MSELTIYSDGAARGNPGPAGAGAAIYDASGKEIAQVCRYLGELTNNQAEYMALVDAIKKASELGASGVKIFADSELMVRQVEGKYRVKNEGLKPLYLELMTLLRSMGRYSIAHVPREKNKRADELANIAIDEHKV